MIVTSDTLCQMLRIGLVLLVHLHAVNARMGLLTVILVLRMLFELVMDFAYLTVLMDIKSTCLTMMETAHKISKK